MAEDLRRRPEGEPTDAAVGRASSASGRAENDSHGELTAAARRAGPDLAGTLEDAEADTVGRPVRRWSSRARSIEGILHELNRIWTTPGLAEVVGAGGERHVAARTSVLNLVVVARRPEVGVRAAATIALMAGRHPSRSVILATADPDGPPWLDAQIEAHCVLPTAGVAETCAEMIYVTAGGDTGRHLQAIAIPLLIHDLPVMLWWPSDPDFHSRPARDLLALADRLVVDGSGWPGDGLDRLVEMAALVEHGRLVIDDLGLVRQARWREAIATVFDLPHLQPFLGSLRALTVDYASNDDRDAEGRTNLVKPIYHVAWLGSRLGMSVAEPLHIVPEGGRRGTLRRNGGTVQVRLRPVRSSMPGGTTERVEVEAQRRGRRLVGEVTAGAQMVDVRIVEEGEEILRRSFFAPRQREVDLVSQVIEDFGRDPVARETLRLAAALASGGRLPSRDGARAGARDGDAALSTEPRDGSEPGPAGEAAASHEARGGR